MMSPFYENISVSAYCENYRKTVNRIWEERVTVISKFPVKPRKCPISSQDNFFNLELLVI